MLNLKNRYISLFPEFFNLILQLPFLCFYLSIPDYSCAPVVRQTGYIVEETHLVRLVHSYKNKLMLIINSRSMLVDSRRKCEFHRPREKLLHETVFVISSHVIGEIGCDITNKKLFFLRCGLVSNLNFETNKYFKCLNVFIPFWK